MQTIGRAARHEEGTVLMYADNITDSMRRAINETARRRDIQIAYNKEHHITPRSVAKEIGEGLRAIIPAAKKQTKDALDIKSVPREEYKHLIKDLTAQMELASANLEFERAAELRDTIQEIREAM